MRSEVWNNTENPRNLARSKLLCTLYIPTKPFSEQKRRAKAQKAAEKKQASAVCISSAFVCAHQQLITRPKQRLDLQRRQDQQLSPMRTLWIRGFVSAAHVKILFTHSFHTQKYTENRRNMLTKATEAGVCIYPHKFAVSISIPDFISKFSHLKADERLETETVSVAGNLW